MARSIHAGPPLWRLELLGGLRAVQRDRVIDRFRTHKNAALLAYLAYHTHRSHPRDELVELLWPECEPAVGRDRLSTALSSLRRQLEPPGLAAHSVILADRQGVRLNPEAVSTDVAEFEAALHAAGRAGSEMERAQLLAEAVEQYGGELLPGCFEEWVFLERQRLTELYLHAHSRLVRYFEQVGDFARACDYAYRAVAADRLREEGHDDLIRLLVASGQPEQALRQYQELERLLDQELDATPSPALRGLIDGIRRRRSGPQRLEEERALAAGGAPPPARRSAPKGLPPATSTLTLLLADLGDSPPPAEALDADSLRDRLDRLRRELESREGHVVRQEGAALLVRFPRASAALAAAIAGQRALHGAEAPSAAQGFTPAEGEGSSDTESGVLRTGRDPPRMALHTGEVEIEVGHCRGLALEQAMRLLRAAHPGQILLSETTAALLRAEVEPGKPGVELVDLGVYRLRDAAAGRETPARLFQAAFPGMARRQFPPPRAAPLHQARLPLQLTRFFGREEEFTQLGAWLLEPTTRLVTLTGPGGSGKTRLALAVAERMVDCFQGAVWFVPLAALREAGLLMDAVITALGLSRSPEGGFLEQAAAFLAPQPCLLLLDNFEQIVEEGAALVQTLLERIPTLTCLITSRVRLDLAGEREFPVSPLPTPGQGIGGRTAPTEHASPNTQHPTPEPLMQNPSVQLFVDRAQAARPDFQVTATNAAAVAELCRRLEGLPLAIELAAARTLALTPAQLLEQLARPLELLVTRRRDAASRHRSLRATLDWSYQLLAPDLQQFFARLSVFRGSWTLAAAEHVCNEPNALEYLETLRENSLVGVEEPGTHAARRVPAKRVDGVSTDVPEPLIPEMRYRLLEPVREYAREQLVASGELAAIRTRHRDYFLPLVVQAAAAAGGREERVWLTRLEAELDNLRSVLAWCQEEADADPDSAAAEAGLRMADALFWFWLHRGYLTDGLQWLEGALARGHKLPAALRASAFFKAAHLVFFGAASLAGKRGDCEQYLTLLQAARDEYEKALTLFRTEANRLEVVRTMQVLAEIATRQADWDAAWAFCTEARSLMEGLSDRVMLARTLAAMVGIALRRGEFQTARPLLEEQLAICWEQGNLELLIHALGGLGHIERQEGNYVRARALYLESLTLRWKLGDQIALAQSFEDLALLAREQQQTERAIRLLGAEERFLETLGARLPVVSPAEYERTIAEGRAALGEARFAAVWAEGRELDLEQALAYASGDGPPTE
jgi:predicted ATPase/DNA-binding SARP family transcriptional activator